MENLAIPEGHVLHVLSVDVIFDGVTGDLANHKNQQRWLAFARRGLIVGVFCGPPCESWSRARVKGGIAGHSQGDGGPRTLRTSEATEGLDTVKVKEAKQLVLANSLLLFTLSLFHILLQQRRFMVVEHPACPEGTHEQWMASIWKMFVTRCLMMHPDVQALKVFQGRYGGASPKPTMLLVLCGHDIDAQAHLDTFADMSYMPAALSMGWCEEKQEYATASLKEYPPQLCKGLASLAGYWIEMRFRSSFSTGMDEEAMSEFLLFSRELARGFNTSAARGADLHIPKNFN